MRVREFDDVAPLISPMLRHVMTVVLERFIDAVTSLLVSYLFTMCVCRHQFSQASICCSPTTNLEKEFTQRYLNGKRPARSVGRQKKMGRRHHGMDRINKAVRITEDTDGITLEDGTSRLIDWPSVKANSYVQGSHAAPVDSGPLVADLDLIASLTIFDITFH